MSDRRYSNQRNAWRLLALCCCTGIASLGYGESSQGLSGAAPSTDRAGVETQLRQLKQALLTLAMDNRARIAASGWTDRNGALSEDLMVFSGLELEKLRPIVRRNRFGVESTQLVYAANTSGNTCGTTPTRLQRLGLSIAIERQSQTANENMARAAAQVLHQHIHAEVAQNKLDHVASLFTTQPLGSQGMSTYLRYMTASPVNTQDLQLDLQVRIADLKPLEHRLGLRERVRWNKSLEVELNLMARGAAVLSLRTDVPLPSSRQSANSQLAWLELPQASKRDLMDWLDEVLPQVARAVNCHGESGLTIAANANEVTLLGGLDAGVYPGQRMAILPSSRRLSIRGLEQSLSVVGLAEVTSVGPRSATLSMYAGPDLRDIADMIAVPMAAFAP